MSNKRLQGFESEHKGVLLRSGRGMSLWNKPGRVSPLTICVRGLFAVIRGEQVPVQCSLRMFPTSCHRRGFGRTAVEGAGWRSGKQVAALVPVCLCSPSSERGRGLGLTGVLSQNAMGQGSQTAGLFFSWFSRLKSKIKVLGRVVVGVL